MAAPAARCFPTVTPARDEYGRGYRAKCSRHGWESIIWPTTGRALRSASAHVRAKRPRRRR